MANGLADEQPPHGPVPEETDDAEQDPETSTEGETQPEDDES